MRNLRAADRLAQAIAEHEALHPLDNHAKGMLARLKEAPEAAEAFAVCPDDRWGVLLKDCITAERETRQHAAQVEACRQAIKAAPDALKGLANVGKYLGLEEPKRPCDDLIRHSYEILSMAIRGEPSSAQDWLKYVSRETHPAAARLRGVGWIKESVKAVSGQPHLQHVASLAEIVLDVELTPDMVDKAIGPRGRRNRRETPRTRGKKTD